MVATVMHELAINSYGKVGRFVLGVVARQEPTSAFARLGVEREVELVVTRQLKACVNGKYKFVPYAKREAHTSCICKPSTHAPTDRCFGSGL